MQKLIPFKMNNSTKPELEILKNPNLPNVNNEANERLPKRITAANANAKNKLKNEDLNDKVIVQSSLLCGEMQMTIEIDETRSDDNQIYQYSYRYSIYR